MNETWRLFMTESKSWHSRAGCSCATSCSATGISIAASSASICASSIARARQLGTQRRRTATPCKKGNWVSGRINLFRSSFVLSQVRRSITPRTKTCPWGPRPKTRRTWGTQNWYKIKRSETWRADSTALSVPHPFALPDFRRRLYRRGRDRERMGMRAHYTEPKNQNPEVTMCPVCLATAAIIAGSATGTSGLTALVAITFRKPKPERPIPHFREARRIMMATSN